MIPTDNIRAVEKLSEILQSIINSGKLFFRGVSDSENHKLIPKIGRNNYRAEREKILFQSFKKQALPYLKSIPDNPWDWLSIAQHYGLETRLLDWTDNILVAIYFAVNKSKKASGAVYAIEIPAYQEYDHDSFLKDKDPLNDLLEKFLIYRPKAISDRIVVQQSLFTVSKDPTKEISHKYKFIIEKELKDNFLYLLDRMGINEKQLFPSLDTLANEININYHKYS